MLILTDKGLNFKPAQRHNIPMVDQVVVMGGDLYIVYPGTVGGTQVFDIKITFP